MEAARPNTHIGARQAPPTYGGSNATNTTYLVLQNANTTRFAVNGSALPDVNFDIGESYAGLLPIGDENSSELFFWYVPSENELAGDEILIWLNGGPGCSSLEGFLQENGPFLCKYYTVTRTIEAVVHLLVPVVCCCPFAGQMLPSVRRREVTCRISTRLSPSLSTVSRRWNLNSYDDSLSLLDRPVYS